MAPNLSNFLDLAAAFPNKGATLASRHHDTQSHWWLAGCCAVGHGTADILKRNSRNKDDEALWFCEASDKATCCGDHVINRTTMQMQYRSIASVVETFRGIGIETLFKNPQINKVQAHRYCYGDYWVV